MLDAMRHGFDGLARFSGADTRATFWPYALAILVAQQVLSWVAAGLFQSSALSIAGEIHMIGDTVSVDMPLIARGAFDLAVIQVLVVALTVLLLAGSVTRRLRDASRSFAPAIAYPCAVLVHFVWLAISTGGGTKLPEGPGLMLLGGLQIALQLTLLWQLAQPSRN
jgi:uncharacterized membrane protein YhaH (DUF805 family)